MSNHEPAPSPKADPDLLTAPHIVSLLMELLAGEKHPDSRQQQHIMSHLTECEECRTALIVLLGAARDADRFCGLPETAATDLLARFARIHRALTTLEYPEYERMGAYAEALFVRGKEVADRSFQQLASHVEQCSTCRTLLEATLAFLAQEDTP